MWRADTRKSLAISLLVFGFLLLAFTIRKYVLPAPSAAPEKIPALQKKWEIDLQDGVEGALALSDDGTVIAASKQGYVYAVDPGGVLQWKTFIGETANSPAIGSDGAIYISNNNGRMVAINRTGSVRWSTTMYRGNTLDHNGGALGRNAIYSASRGALTAMSLSDGSILWSSGYGTDQWASVTLLSDGLILYSGRNQLHAVDSHGAEAWAYPPSASLVSGKLGFGSSSGIAPGPDNQLIMASGKKCSALGMDGTLHWEFPAPSYQPSFATPVIASDGTIYFGDANGILHAMFSYGAEKWSVSPGGSIIATPMIAADGTIFVVAASWLSAISPDGRVLAKFDLGGITSSPTLAPDGTVYVVNNSGRLAAFAGMHGGLMDSPWPKYQGDAANTGNAGQF